MLVQYSYYHWGPFLCRLSITDTLRKEIIKRGRKSKIDYTRQLASNIENTKAFDQLDRTWIDTQLQSYTNAYINSFKEYNTDKTVLELNQLQCTAVWINFQRRGEANPEHIHGEDFSFVCYLQVPAELTAEIAQYKGAGHAPGTLVFRYGEAHAYGLNTQCFIPKECELYIFPSWLYHGVPAYKSNCERISISGNFKVIK